MGHIATNNIACSLSAAEAWEKLRDLSLAHNYVTEISSSKITTEQKEGVGASRRVAGKQHKLDETVSEWNEGKGFTIRLHNGDKPAFPFTDAHFTYRIDSLDDKNCKLTATMIYEVRWGVIGALLNTLILSGAVRKSVRDIVLGMKSFYESGEPVTADKLKELRAIPEEKLPSPY